MFVQNILWLIEIPSHNSEQILKMQTVFWANIENADGKKDNVNIIKIMLTLSFLLSLFYRKSYSMWRISKNNTRKGGWGEGFICSRQSGLVWPVERVQTESAVTYRVHTALLNHRNIIIIHTTSVPIVTGIGKWYKMKQRINRFNCLLQKLSILVPFLQTSLNIWEIFP
jgi:hypothetical protein